MSLTAGIDVGSTYTKAVVSTSAARIVGRAHGADRLQARRGRGAHARTTRSAPAGLPRADVAYVVATGFGRHQVACADMHVTDLTAARARRDRAVPRHAHHPRRRRPDDEGQRRHRRRAACKSFRLNDKCAAGTGRVPREDRALHGLLAPRRSGRSSTTSKDADADLRRVRRVRRVRGDQPALAGRRRRPTSCTARSSRWSAARCS